MLLKSDIDETNGEFAGDPASKGNRRGTADNLHSADQRVVWVGAI